MIETFAALAEPNRLRIVELLRGGPCSVNEIGARLALHQPQVSKHLRTLKEAGLVAVELRAQQRVYAIEPRAMARLHDWIERYRKVWDGRFGQLDILVAELMEREHSDDSADAK
jgi:DNA-binding transcriptional ArsR family regulator